MKKIALAFLLASQLAVASPMGTGNFTLTTKAGVGDSYSGSIAVNGLGKFQTSDDGDKFTFVSNVADGDLQMKDGRQSHTVGEDSKLGLTKGQKVTLTVAKANVNLPSDGITSSGVAKGKLRMLGKDQDVKVKYEVTSRNGKYAIKSASFTFDYTKHTGKKICLFLVCVQPVVTINVL